MRLHPAGREWIQWALDADPGGPLEVSFDAGSTWWPMTRGAGGARILVQGPDAGPATAATLLPLGAHRVVIRAVDDPQLLVRDGGLIEVW